MAQLNLRFEDGLHQQMKQAAAESMRSLQKEIIWRLKASLAAQQQKAAKPMGAAQLPGAVT